MRALTLSLVSLAACGGGDSKQPTVDAPKDIGFKQPTAALHANMTPSGGAPMDLGPADLSCLGTTSGDMATTVAVALATTVKDFQNHTLNGGAMDATTISVFKDVDIATLVDTQMSTTTGCNSTPAVAPCGAVTVTIPTGVKRFGFKMTDGANAFLPTLLLNQKVDPAGASQTLDKIQTVSNATAELLSGLIGETRQQGTGVLAGALRDCQGHEMSNFVATASSTSMTATPIMGAEAYYFSHAAGTDLPNHHCDPTKGCGSSQLDMATGDGLFMVIQLPPTAGAYVQMWGYKTDAEVGGNMTLISELQVPVLADTVITGSFEELRQ
jgi:hypothetical protein